jgi:hypothetical protein
MVFTLSKLRKFYISDCPEDKDSLFSLHIPAEKQISPILYLIIVHSLHFR